MTPRGTHDHDVIVVGAGPTGLLIAAQLTRLGLDVAVLERRHSSGGGTRAIGVHAPVLAALEASGATERILAEAVRVSLGIARTRQRVLGEVHFDRLALRFPFVATVPQAVTEAAVATGGPEPRRGMRVDSVVPHGDGVRVRGVTVPMRATTGASDAEPAAPDAAASAATDAAEVEGELTASFVVVAGGASARGLTAMSRDMHVHTYRDRYLMADVPEAVSGETEANAAVIHLNAAGVLESFPLPGGGRRLVAWDRFTRPDEKIRGGWLSDDPADLARLRDAVADRTGHADGAAGIERVSAFGVRRAVAPRMREGRMFIIGDAAHEVSPIGGQGMNLGLLDAAGLAPLIADWARTGTAPDTALARWEKNRLRSAHTAARLAGLNTALGRSRPAWAHAPAMTTLRAALAGPFASVPANAYAMGLDRGA